MLTLLARLDNGYRLFPDCRRFISKPPSDYARKLYYDTCCFFPPMLDMAARLVGAERLLWGSDEPYIGAS
ncbi:hypothetical protein, partial [Klebsiella pneumoniae]|uniref:hypothetical protein n=1 Tax=Klebsiella pneumoniae TaxID=573 RepID=UPI001953BDE8